MSQVSHRHTFIMAFEAINTETGERIQLYALDDIALAQLKIKIELGEIKATCCDTSCDCVQDLRAISSDYKAPHFYTRTNYKQGSWAHGGGGESAIHKMAKLAIARFIMQQDAGVIAHTENEQTFENGKRADVVAHYKDGSFVIHEAQYAFQRVDVTARRTETRRATGARAVVWWWGGRTLKQKHYQEWCIENCTHYGELREKTEEIAGIKKTIDVIPELFDSAEIKAKREKEYAALAAFDELQRRARTTDNKRAAKPPIVFDTDITAYSARVSIEDNRPKAPPPPTVDVNALLPKPSRRVAPFVVDWGNERVTHWRITDTIERNGETLYAFDGGKIYYHRVNETEFTPYA